MEVWIFVLNMVIIVLLSVHLIVYLGRKNKENRDLQELERLFKDGMYQLERNQNVSSTNMENRLFQSMTELSKLQQNELSQMAGRNQQVMYQVMERVDKKLEGVRNTVDDKFQLFQESNEKQLLQIRNTVDENLHKTLEEKLGRSFQLVSERLEQVHKGLGEMSSLAEGVGDLKKVLSNVKLRGIVGEIQLEQILQQILSPEQYEKNVKLNPTTQNMVEFAIKLPGRLQGEYVYLPLDAKFPMEAYFRLTEAFDALDKEAIDKAGKELETALRKSAKDVFEKYVYPPKTTDFAIMFLPTEGLYAEATRRPELLETLQREYKVVVAGPSNFAALLNSLQMGFRTLAIETRTGEVWNLLSLIRTEFYKFGAVLEKTQKKMSDASSELDQLVGVRSRKLLKELDKITELDEGQISQKKEGEYYGQEER